MFLSKANGFIMVVGSSKAKAKFSYNVDIFNQLKQKRVPGNMWIGTPTHGALQVVDGWSDQGKTVGHP